jgi:hypothetical protein
MAGGEAARAEGQKKPELLIDESCMRLYFHHGSGIVHHEIRKNLTSEVFRRVLSHGAEILEKTTASKWLSDNRGHFQLSDADEQWAKTVWFPRAVAAGWKHWAILRPESAIGALNLSRLSQNYARLGVNTRILSDFSEALRWLEGC